MRVLMVSKACIVAAYRRKLEELASLGIDLTVVVPPYWQQHGRRQLLEPGHTQGYRLVVLPAALNGHFHLHFYPRLREVIADVRPEVVHLDEEPYDFVTYHGLRLARRADAAVVFFSWQNLRRRLPPPFTAFQKAVFQGAAGAIAGNQEALSILRERGWQGPGEVIPQFGVDDVAFAPPRTRQRAGTPFVIGYAGRLVPEKGLPVLLDAVAGLEGDWRLVLVGDGTDRAALTAQAARLGIVDRVEFRIGIPSTAMPDFYRTLDVLALPSLTRPNWKEQFGRVLVEAMACAVAVVGSESGEIPHVIGDGGLVFPEGDAVALRARLAELMRDVDLRGRLGELGRARVLAHYTHRDVARRTAVMYKHALDNHRPSGASGLSVVG